MTDGNDILEFGLEDTRIWSVFLLSDFFSVLAESVPVEVLRSTNGDNGVGVCQAGEDADPSDFVS